MQFFMNLTVYMLHWFYRTADTSGMAMKENAAYGPVTSSQQPQDYIYAQPDAKTEGEYDIVK